MKPKAVFIGVYVIDNRIFVRVDDGKRVLAEYAVERNMELVASFTVIDNICGAPLEAAPRNDGLFLFMSARPRR